MNRCLRQYNSPTTVVAFIIMPATTNNYNVEALKGQAVTKRLKDVVQQVTERIGQRIYESALRYGQYAACNSAAGDRYWAGRRCWTGRTW